ncbi:hypothetical protein SORBI_3007G144200 [Sorghum bicolor]|uniref:Uncharacterized protein n=1 Tax=Sorghum bicolor TaxID=4558 RepID=A0A1B6PHU1_SORBI|nr:hypothetical protein SORBI_3007G144200 [Sorghum bicolor]
MTRIIGRRFWSEQSDRRSPPRQRKTRNKFQPVLQLPNVASQPVPQLPNSRSPTLDAKRRNARRPEPRPPLTTELRLPEPRPPLTARAAPSPDPRPSSALPAPAPALGATVLGSCGVPATEGQEAAKASSVQAAAGAGGSCTAALAASGCQARSQGQGAAGRSDRSLDDCYCWYSLASFSGHQSPNSTSTSSRGSTIWQPNDDGGQVVWP